MNIPINSVGVSLSSQSNPIYQMMAKLKASLQENSLLNSETDQAIKETAAILSNPDTTNGMQIGQALMNLVSTIERTDKTGGMTSQIYKMLGQIQSDSTQSSPFPIKLTAKAAQARKEIADILGGGIENMQELKSIMLLLDMNPTLMTEDFLGVINEATKDFITNEISKCTKPEEIQNILEDIQGIVTAIDNTKLVTMLNEIQFDPEINQAIEAVFPEETASSILTSSGITATSETNGIGDANNQGITNAPSLNWSSSGFLPEAIDPEEIDPSIVAPIGVNISSLQNTTPTQPASDKQFSNNINNISKTTESSASILPNKPRTGIQTNTSNANQQSSSQKKDPLTAAQVTKPIQKQDSPTKDLLASKPVPPKEKEHASPDKPKPIRVELHSWGKSHTSQQGTTDRTSKSNNFEQFSQTKQSTKKTTQDLSRAIAMAAQSNIDHKKLGIKGKSSNEMSHLLNKPKPNARKLSDAYDKDPVGVTEHIYLLLMGLTHLRMEESINNISLPGA